jgi:predicted DsbA family dithiol-disulfide isomerase
VALNSAQGHWQDARMSVPQSDVDGPEPRVTEVGAVVLDWWCDLACPDCADTLDLLESLVDRFDDRVAPRLRHFPLTNHVWAVAAAQCAAEATVQGDGMNFVAAALRMIDDVDGPADYVELADDLGLDADAVASALFDGRHAAAVRDEHDAGRDLGVMGTPTFVVDGLLVDGSTSLEGVLDVLAARIEAALRS